MERIGEKPVASVSYQIMKYLCPCRRRSKYEVQAAVIYSYHLQCHQ